MLPGTRLRPGKRRAVAVLSVAAATAVAVSGCSPHGGGKRKSAGERTASSRTARAEDGPTATSRPGAGRGPAPKPRTAEQFTARARQAMAAEKGWTFALRGSETLLMQGQRPSTATYAATADRTTAPAALRQSGLITTSKEVRKPELVYVVGGTGYVKEGAEAWKHGPLSDPDIADDVEDPVAELEAFGAYARSAKVQRTGAGGRHVRLQVSAAGWSLPAARSRPALKRAVREMEPALAQLRDAGVTASDGSITLKSFTETWNLDAAHGYRLVSHRYAYTFLVPYRGGDITVSQEVRADNHGVFTGRVTLPADAGR
ncbi:hypothetical protein [Streptomyces sp. 142MFCol3.1]|uniref:hypothetical protein n=1 Tax=Streptomyces sp. 142MFCol3.1 TaxID=1172179 RepID=UPI00040EB1D2|nr:hypothetical protein [Streptomyces sp. 142MFCol3.1]